MKTRIIAHRANQNGPESGQNNPEAIRTALQAGYDIELDIWWHGHQLYLGHDEPTHQLPYDLLTNTNIWWHAKNHQALQELIAHNNNPNVFWHQEDDLTITSHGHIWCHPKHPHPGPKNILLLLDRHAIQRHAKLTCYAICTDYPKLI